MSSVNNSEGKKGINMPKTTPEQNKALVLEAFDTLFNKRDYAAGRWWVKDKNGKSVLKPPGWSPDTQKKSLKGPLR